ncbi:peptidoglycan-binding protein LysM, partial [Xanthomonas perforans]|nr:peptidoglycan-binding protein LysM [Xanthomonas perforans]
MRDRAGFTAARSTLNSAPRTLLTPRCTGIAAMSVDKKADFSNVTSPKNSTAEETPAQDITNERTSEQNT